MRRHTLLCGFLICAVIMMAQLSHAKIFIVTTISDNDCSDSDCDLQAAFNEAESNDEVDIINVAAGTYVTPGAVFKYVGAPTENHALTITGVGAATTTLDGGNSDQVMLIDLSGVTDDALADVSISGLTFTKGTSVNGGGLEVITTAAAVSVSDSLFDDNDAGTIGAGLSIVSVTGAVLVANNTFTANESADRAGGARVRETDGDVSLIGNTFNGNMAPDQGGGIDVSASGLANILFERNTFIDNTSADEGGGAIIDIEDGDVVLVNNIFKRNKVTGGRGDGGGAEILLAGGGAFTMTHNTFYDNDASNTGGAILLLLNTSSSTAAIFNNIIYANTAVGDGDDLFIIDDDDGDMVGQMVTLSHNDISDVFSTCTDDVMCAEDVTFTANIDADPLLVDPDNDDCHLQENSPARDAGTDTAPELPAEDFEGDDRVLGSAPDMGADELVPDADGDGVTDADDNCPDDANSDQADADGDGIGNVCDDTPGNGGDGDDGNGCSLVQGAAAAPANGLGALFIGLLTLGLARRRRPEG